MASAVVVGSIGPRGSRTYPRLVKSALDEEERILRCQIRHRCDVLRRAGLLAHWFRRLVKARRSHKLDAWLARARDAQAPAAWNRFAKSLLDDHAAVKAALSLPWSNGQVGSRSIG